MPLGGADDQPLADGAGEDSGAAYVVKAPVAGFLDLGDADARLVGERAHQQAGRSLYADDLDGDGGADLIVGAPGIPPLLELEEDPGTTCLVLGPGWGEMPLAGADARLVGETPGHRAGSARPRRRR